VRLPESTLVPVKMSHQSDTYYAHVADRTLVLVLPNLLQQSTTPAFWEKHSPNDEGGTGDNQ
jgi:hypothetical protein